tara:strand:+ start:56 stop:682 length:627 start_codon:yes stop_codon:yes gene_type:complete
MNKVAILDYGTGNIASLLSSVNSLNSYAYLANTSKDLKKANALILPGVGHYGHALNNLHKNSLTQTVINLVESGLPTLGICLGFQILTKSSEEANRIPGLGLLNLETKRLKQDFPKRYKIPHIGWNSLTQINKKLKLLKGIPKKDQLFYFCNSYGVNFLDEFKGISAEYTHENNMIAVAEYKNIYGVQFHPEKSRTQGLKIISNFLNL